MTMRQRLTGRKSLVGRLVLTFLVLSVVMVAVLGLVSYLRARDALEASVYARLDTAADQKVDALDRWIDEQRRNVVFVAGLLGGYELGAAQGLGAQTSDLLSRPPAAARKSDAHDAVVAALKYTVSQTADAEEFLVLDLDGHVVASTTPDHEDLSQTTQEYFRRGSSATWVEPVSFSVLTRQPTITIATPLFDRDGQRVAVVAANLNLQRIDRIVLQQTGLGDTGETYVVGPDHRFVHAALSKGEFANGVSSRAIDAALAKQEGRSLYESYRGTPVIGVYRWVEEIGVAMVAEQSQREAFAPARRLAFTIGGIGLLVVGLLALGIYAASRRIARPILAITETATAVRAGDLTREAPVTTEDEVGVLAGAFNDMTAELRETLEGLEQRVEERTDELNRQKEYFEALVEISPVAVVTMDTVERVTAWNPAATRQFGYTAEEAVGRPIDELVLGSEDQREEGQELAREALGSGRGYRVGQRTRKDGSLVDVEIAMVPLVVDGEHVGFYAIYHDITELEDARRRADDANQAKSIFLASMSHEIRTPMNAIIGMSGLLLRTELDGDQQESAEIIRTSSEALLTIINDILDFSKIEAGRMELELAPFDVRECIDGAVALIRTLATGKGLELTAELDEAVPRTIVGDVSRLRQILLNMLNNAVKFTDEGTVALTADAKRDGEEIELHVAVKDSGIGISEEGLARLFQSFSQADVSISRRYGGTGLGLAISKRLAEAMGGTMWAESDGIPGRGSTFHVTIATREAADVLPSRPDTLRPGAADVGPERGERHPLRILLAEDNVVNQKLALRLLSLMGYEADIASNGLEAVEAVERQAYDLVLMDVQMPELDGFEATRKIIERQGAARPRIVAMTANAMDGDREACFEAGMDDYVSKPIRVEELVAALDRTPATPAGAE
jgi:PAS domain S-box-containing protein